MRYTIIITFLIPLLSFSQEYSGKVTDMDNIALFGANVYWIETTTGTTTDEEGAFIISGNGINDKRLVVSYVGFKSDTVEISSSRSVLVSLEPLESLTAVQIEGTQSGSYISAINPIKTEVINQVELTKAACCDLAGCFDTQGSVQPTTTNVVTNAKELRILGLSGVYNQVLIDGMPLIQGLSYTYGISSVPGTLVDNIYVSKGANSILQGFESISGQINVELKEPDNAEKLLLNAYINSFNEKQFNANYTKRIKKWSTILSAHTAQPGDKFDRDKDFFLDLPLLTRYSFFNKWKYGVEKNWGWHARFAVRYVNEERIGGQTFFDPETDKGTMNAYGQTINYSQPEIYTKTGYRFNDRHHLVYFGSAFNHNQHSYFGTTSYKANQTNAYSNLQYELTYHKSHILKTGLSYRMLRRDEDIEFSPDSLSRTYDGLYVKDEVITGVFAENTFDWKNRKYVLITGLRVDNHNEFGIQVTPRALYKMNLTANSTVRVSAGTGWRTVNIFSENINLLASSRDVIVTENLEPEKAVNIGANYTHKFFLPNVETQITLDVYRTQFQNQIFPDYDTDPTKAYISNFKGTSISNGFQGEIGFEFHERVGVKIVYNYLDVYRIVNNEKYILPFNPTHRFTGSFSFRPLSKKWHFDMNAHYYGEQRLANTSDYPSDLQRPSTSEPYYVINIQYTQNLKRFELYAGCENIFDFRQERPIVSWQNPFSPYFDTSSIWGPTRGREFYAGVRYIIK